MKKGVVYGGLFLGGILTQVLACTVEKSINMNLSEPIGKFCLMMIPIIAFYEVSKKQKVQLKQK
ncbi:hypothetical protein SAMN02745163_01906 [Clostridium cavendishii DSM 21758]|uniref:Uncharacterized protein n=1 Tax=Clostridium cavendishii DSM 21758 TaxID=1121302 RepID=A0A1M6J3T3_9CLOT|nr:hypothetical protein [Clostridium cavendishii]SHJ41390.1 hypothetical protein SAMN02745163_01906 [Clostridium cavendishii DSM 21758]